MNIPMVDTLIATVDIENYEFVAKDLILQLENKKNEAKLLASQCINEKVVIGINDMTFQVLSNGSKGYSYILHNDDYEVKLSQFRSKSQDFYPLFVKIKSECLWSNGVENSWNTFIKWVNEGIGKVINNKINRMDLCCHTDELNLKESDIETFKGKYHTDHIDRTNRKVNAMCFGSRSGSVYCRIYDKTLETKIKQSKMWFFDIWKNKGLDSEKVWNVEFEIKREFFKNKKINSVEDAFSKIKSIWLYCTVAWLVKVKLNRTRIERCEVDSIWLNIQKSFEEYKEDKLVSRDRQLETSALALVPGTIGNLTSYAARLGKVDIEEILSNLIMNGFLYLNGKNKDYTQVINDKMALLKTQDGRV